MRVLEDRLGSYVIMSGAFVYSFTKTEGWTFGSKWDSYELSDFYTVNDLEECEMLCSGLTRTLKAMPGTYGEFNKMTPEQRSAYANAEIAQYNAEIEGMRALNAERLQNGYTPGHDEASFCNHMILFHPLLMPDNLKKFFDTGELPK